MSAEPVSYEAIKALLPSILENLPSSWLGTTFKNKVLLEREGFEQEFFKLVAAKTAANDKNVSTDELLALGNAEDYLRVASNMSTVLEIALATEKKLKVSQVFTFGSYTMPSVAVTLAVKKPVTLFVGAEKNPFSQKDLDHIGCYGAHLEIVSGSSPSARDGRIVLAYKSALGEGEWASPVDGVIDGDVLYILNEQEIDSHEVLVIRKRMATPVTTPVAQARLQEIAGVPVTANIEAPSEEELKIFYAHLQELSGTPVNPDCNPVVCTAGLPTVASVWHSVVALGGADIVMASTAYGGSSQLTDLLAARAEGLFKKHTFDIQGTATMADAIGVKLKLLAETASERLPITLLWTEIPTNPDMKVPNLKVIAGLLHEYKQRTNVDVILMIDATFAPGCKVLSQLRELDEDLSALVFISMSKSISRGVTTAGTVLANHTAKSIEVVNKARYYAEALDITAKPDQQRRLTDNHRGVEDRCAKAYEVTASIGDRLVAAVKQWTGENMPLAFVSPESAKLGFSSSTFSFNLPAPRGSTAEERAALAQHFVDLLTAHDTFKPCVSFGQDNGLVYATVPATSTQGAIKEEHKAKQAVGGVQLTRLSFAPSTDVEVVSKQLEDAVKSVYEGQSA